MHHSVTLRPVSADDESFLFDLFCAGLEQQFASPDMPAKQEQQLLRMQFAARDSQYRARFPDAHFDLILHKAIPVGNLFAQRGPDEFVLIDLTLLPEHRGRGIGSELVSTLIAAANVAKKPLHAHVLLGNPAWQLWQRLGFRHVSDDGVYRKIEVPAGRA